LQLKNKLRKLLTGLSIPQEYVCLDLAAYKDPISVSITIQDNGVETETFDDHLFLGYKPLLIGLPIFLKSDEYESIKGNDFIRLNFRNSTGLNREQAELARLDLKKVGEMIFGDYIILLFEGIHGEHSFIHSLYQFVNIQREKFRKSPSTNVSLAGNLLDQVRIAYAIPRIISLITVSDGHQINIFPTDLHGPIGEKFYLGSLRIGGKANEQVEHYKKIVLSEVSATVFKSTYALGKNHMGNLQDVTRFSLHPEKSKVFNFPLPEAATSYRELQQIDCLDRGIHRIHVYEVLNQSALQRNHSTLAHIHQYYAQWRLSKGLPTEMLLR